MSSWVKEFMEEKFREIREPEHLTHFFIPKLY